MQGKAKAALEGRFKEADHLGNLDDVGGEKIRAPDLNAKKGFIAGNEGLFIKGLDPTKAHDVRILQGSPKIFGTTRVPNLTNLSVLTQTPQWAFLLCTDRKNDWAQRKYA